MRFRVTRHTGYGAPADALELLLSHLGPRRDDVSFSMVGSEIRARWDEEISDSVTRAIKAEAMRWEIFQIIERVCENAPALRSDWYAVSYID